MEVTKVPAPAWAYNSNSPYGGTYSDVPNVSKYYPSYSYMRMNSNINRDNNPAFVQNARAGICGNGIALYGYLNSYVAADYQQHKETTHVWSMAIPETMSIPVGLFTIQANVFINQPPNYDTIGTRTQYNMAIYIDTDYTLKVGAMTGSGYPPVEVHNYGVNMHKYLYPVTAPNTGSYVGHRYAFMYNTATEAYDLFIDNTATKLLSLNSYTLIRGGLAYMNSPMYNDYFAHGNSGGFVNYYYIGPGVYMYNSSASYNICNQGNVYFSDWVGWETSFNADTLSALMNFNFKQMKAPKTNSSYGTFYYCNRIESIILPGSMNNIPGSTLYGSNLHTVVFREGVKNISRYAVKSSGALSVTIPKSVVNISAGAFNGSSIALSPVSYNLIMRDNMFSNINMYHNYDRYEHLEGLTVYNMPTKQSRPSKWYLQNNNYEYNAPAYITPVTKQADIDSSGDLLSFTWHNMNVQLMFNESVNKAVHSNAVGYQPHSMTADGYVLDIYSLEFPTASVSTRYNFVDDEDFILDTLQLTSTAVLGHTTGEFNNIPSIFDSSYITRDINFNTTGYKNGPSHINIEIPKMAVDNQYTYKLNINQLPPDTSSVYLHDGHATTVYSGAVVSSRTYSASNVNFIKLAAKLDAPIQLTNCYNVFGTAPANTSVYDLCNNFITVDGNYTDLDLSSMPLNFRFWRIAKNDDVSVLNDEEYLSHLDSDSYTIFTLSYLNDIQKDDYNFIRGYWNDAYWGYANANTMFISNSMLPSTIMINNVWGQSGQFTNCTGDVNVIIGGYATISNGKINKATPGTTATRNVCMFESHVGTLNFNINVARIPVKSYAEYPTTNHGFPLSIANNCNIDTLKLAYSDNYANGSNYKMAVENNIAAFAAIIYNSNINTLIIDEPVFYCIRNCRINNIVYSGVRLPALVVTNCKIYCSVQDILNNIDSTPNLYGTNFVGDTDVTVYRQKTTTAFDTTSGQFSNMHVANSLTIIDDTAFTDYVSASGIKVPHVIFKGRTAPSFSSADIKTAHIECTELSSFWYARNVETITGLENCLYIGVNTFAGCNNLTDLTVHPNCSVHSRAFYDMSHTPTIHYGNGAKYPVDLNIDYNSTFIDPNTWQLITANSRVHAAPKNWGSIKDRIKVNIVFNDGSEEPTDDYIIYPNFPCAETYAYSNLYHTVYANGVHKRILAPYNYCGGSYNTNAILRTKANYPSTGYIGQQFDIIGDCGELVRLSGNPYYATASSTRNRGIGGWHSLRNITTVLFVGNYNSIQDSWSNGLSSLRNGILANRYLVNGSIILESVIEYFRDDCVYAFASSPSMGSNNSSQYRYGPHTLDFHLSTKSTYAIGNNMIRNCSAKEIFLHAGATARYIANNAVNNAPNLYWVDMNLITYSGFRINDDAFINCPMLQRLRVPAGTSYIGNGAFNRTGLKYVEIPSACTLGTNAFPADCTITYY